MRGWLATCLGFFFFFNLFFAPAQIGKLMASGDALLESLPAFLGAHNLWEPTMFLGYPLFADPNQQYWYPFAWTHALRHAYNFFAIAPFIIAASGMAGFIRSLTWSTYAGIAAGLVYALGGFMIAHAGHLMITHPAAWTPFVLWALELTRRRRDAVPLVAGAIALGLCGVAGQPQVFAFTITLAAGYAAVSARQAQIGARVFVGRAAALLALGTAFAGVQLVPEAVLALESTRASLDLHAFTLDEIPLAQLALRAVFPYIFGITHVPIYAFSTIDSQTFTEETIAVGVVSIALAFISLPFFLGERRIAFWAFVACAALVLAVGDATPLAGIIHALPVYGLFRAPGRHAFEWTFAIAVLAGYGAAVVERGRVSFVHLTWAAGSVLCLLAIAYLQLVSGTPSPFEQLAQAYGTDSDHIVSPFSNGAVGMPIATGALGLIFIAAAVFTRRRRSAGAWLVLAVALDIGAFAWPAYWNWGAIRPERLGPSPIAQRLAGRSEAAGTRIAWLPGTLAPELAPNLTTFWNIPSVDGYTPLVPRRTAALLGITASGGVTASLDPSDTALDLAGASPVVTPAEPPEVITPEQPFSARDMHVFLTSEPAGRTRAAFALAQAIPATKVALVSELGEATLIPQGSHVAELVVVYKGGRRERHPIVAGRDTAEFAYDRADVRPRIRHRRGQIVGGDAVSHRYVAFFRPAHYVPIVRVEITWKDTTSPSVLTVEKLSLINERLHSAAAFGSIAWLYAAPEHWRPVSTDAAFVAFDNRHALPRAWFARPVAVDAAGALQAVRTGSLPGGSAFDPRRQAAVEGQVGRIAASGSDDTVRIETDEPTRQRLVTVCAQTCFLVMRQAFDANWRARIDDAPAVALPTDIALRGIVVPAGKHRIAFDFVPVSLYIGMLTTVFAVLVSLVLVWRFRPELRGPVTRTRTRLLQLISNVPGRTS